MIEGREANKSGVMISMVRVDDGFPTDFSTSYN